MVTLAELSEVRIDKWLWAARCFKTRSVATDACAAGHVKLNGVSVKASKVVRVGDNIEVLTPGGERILEVQAIGDKRGPASVAAQLYIDHTPPPPPKEERVGVPVRERGMGRPSKRDQRLLRKLRGY
jgi:ribosome-associated heat shock protein Hsp15